MPRILMVRHGRAAASFTDDLDPGLDELGQQQAESVAAALRSELPLALISSPLRRAMETAHPLQALQGGELSIEERVSEIPSPGLDLSERGDWLRGVMQGQWSQQDAALQAWRKDLVNCLIQQPVDCVIFSHFVAINVAVAAAEQNDRVIVFRPDNTSVTELRSDGQQLTLAHRGEEAVTQIN